MPLFALAMPPPWVLMSLAFGFAGHLQDIKEIGGLAVSIVVPGRGEGAGCSLCEKLVEMILKEVELDEMSEGGGIQCGALCFGFGKCVRQCDKIVGAMANSTGFPCMAAGICPAVDDWGDVSCAFSYKSMGCEPRAQCARKGFLNQCELKPSYKKWKKMGSLVSEEFNALAGGLTQRKRCSEKDAGPYCIKDSEGLGYLAEVGGLVLTFLGAAAFSIRAIETPGGDDDRQWLTFWMVFVLFSVAEHFTDVLISRMPLCAQFGAQMHSPRANSGIKYMPRAYIWQIYARGF